MRKSITSPTRAPRSAAKRASRTQAIVEPIKTPLATLEPLPHPLEPGDCLLERRTGRRFEVRGFEEGYYTLNHCQIHAEVSARFTPKEIEKRFERVGFVDSCVPFVRPVKVLGEADRAVAVHDAIARLEIERQSVLGGSVAPDGCWIETGKIRKKEFRQAYWRSYQPMFAGKRNAEVLTKRQYIGREGSPEHQAAIEAIERRNRLKEIEKQLEWLSEDLC